MGWYEQALGAARYKAERDVALQELDRVKAQLEAVRKTCRNEGLFGTEFLCSICGYRDYRHEHNYCPNCGAKVVKE